MCQSLTKRLIRELQGDMERVMVALTTPMFEYLAGELYHSMAGLGTREKVLIEILCPATNFEIQNIKRAYQACEYLVTGHYEQMIISRGCSLKKNPRTPKKNPKNPKKKQKNQRIFLRI